MGHPVQCTLLQMKLAWKETSLDFMNNITQDQLHDLALRTAKTLRIKVALKENVLRANLTVLQIFDFNQVFSLKG